jgi:hypothetical protein
MTPAPAFRYPRDVSHLGSVAMHIMPIIRPSDYDAFRSILNDQLPDTYGEWLQSYMESQKKFRHFREPYRGIEIYPQEFVNFCLSRNAVATIKLLAECALEKAFGENH